MDSYNSDMSKDQFNCFICLDLLTEPVSIPCGHKFCKTCISEKWDSSDHYQCPLCQEILHRRHELSANIPIGEALYNDIALVSLKAPSLAPSLALNQALAQASIRDQDTAPALAIGRCDHLPGHVCWKIVFLALCLFFAALLFSLCFKVQYLKREGNKRLKKDNETEVPGDDEIQECTKIQPNAVNVTLDPDTAHPSLIVSEDGKQVRNGHTRQKLPDNPERIDPVVSVLGKEGFSSGRFYYEVQVKKKTEWSLGVARQSIKRKGIITLKPVNGFWAVWLRNEEYKARSDPDVVLSLTQKLKKVGVFVDYEEGQVSFYDAESRSLIYSYNGQNFTEKLYPYFSPSLTYGGRNSAPLIIPTFCQ